MSMTDVKLLIRNLEVMDRRKTADEYSRKYSLVYREGRICSECLEIGAELTECGIFRFDRERAGFTYIDSLCLEKEGATYCVSYILR